MFHLFNLYTKFKLLILQQWCVCVIFLVNYDILIMKRCQQHEYQVSVKCVYDKSFLDGSKLQFPLFEKKLRLCTYQRSIKFDFCCVGPYTNVLSDCQRLMF